MKFTKTFVSKNPNTQNLQLSRITNFFNIYILFIKNFESMNNFVIK